MYSIILIEDIPYDAERIQHLLSTTASFGYQITHYTDFSTALHFLQTQTADLILLDLQFTKSGQTCIPVINQLPASIPILIVSALDHYQPFLSAQQQITGFVSKKRLTSDLLPQILKSLKLSFQLEDSYITFPSVTSHSLSTPRFPVSQIKSIEFANRKEYTVTLTSGCVQIIPSVPLSHFCKHLKDLNIPHFLQISRSTFINAHHISQIKKDSHGKLLVYLVNQASAPFIVSSTFEKSLHSLLHLSS